MNKSQIIRHLLALLSLCVFCCAEANAATILCSKDGNIVVRVKRCSRGEKRVSATQLVQQAAAAVASQQGPQGVPGPIGPKGDVGPAGPKGDPAGFDVATCSVVNSKAAPAGVPANTAGTATVSCNTTTQFLLTSSFNVAPSGSPVNKPFVQYKSLILDATNKYPVGVTYGFLQSVSGGSNYDVYAQGVCCTK